MCCIFSMLWIYVYMYVHWMSIPVYTYVYVCMYACMYSYICLFIYVKKCRKWYYRTDPTPAYAIIAPNSPGYIWNRIAEKEARSITDVTTVIRKSSDVLVNARISSAMRWSGLSTCTVPCSHSENMRKPSRKKYLTSSSRRLSRV